MFTMYLLLILLLLLLLFHQSFTENSNVKNRRKPHCKIYGDTIGKWVYINSTSLEEIKKSYIDYNPGEALLFDRIWIPLDCSYLRFTNDTIYKAVEYTRLKRNLNIYNIIFMGDSASRGIANGIIRILSGSELYGPCENSICGDKNHKVPNVDSMHGYFEEKYGNLLLSFIYVKSWLSNHLDW